MDRLILLGAEQSNHDKQFESIQKGGGGGADISGEVAGFHNICLTESLNEGG
jgi:hypothetical protein